MARTKENPTASADEKITEPADITNNEIVDTTDSTDTEKTDKAADKKAKKIADDDDVKIKCESLAGKSVIGTDLNKPIIFDEKGIATVKGIVAKRFITIPGYTLA